MIACVLLALVVAAGTDLESAQAVAKHRESLERIDSYYLKIESSMAEDDEPGKPLVKDSLLEVWSSGLSHRSRKRVFYFVDASSAALKHSGTFGDVTDSSVDARVSRSLMGWDHEHPYELPLEFGRSAKEFSLVHCSIQPSDPTQLDVRREEESSLMGWHIRPGWSLSELADVCEITVVPQSNPSVTRLKIVSTTSPEIPIPGFTVVGSILDLDHEHGWLVSRIETPCLGSSIIRRVVEFREAASGIWYPVEAQSTFGTDVCSVAKVLECKINRPINENLLRTPFPAGARVVEYPGRINHIWGEEGPVETFAKSEDFMEYVYARAREYQRGPIGPMQSAPAEARSGRRLLIIVNVVLLSLLALFTFLRRRLAPKA